MAGSQRWFDKRSKEDATYEKQKVKTAIRDSGQKHVTPQNKDTSLAPHADLYKGWVLSSVTQGINNRGRSA